MFNNWELHTTYCVGFCLTLFFESSFLRGQVLAQDALSSDQNSEDADVIAPENFKHGA